MTGSRGSFALGALLPLAFLIVACSTEPERIPLGAVPAAYRPLPPNETDSERRAVESLLEKMSLPERVGQRFMGYIPSDGITDTLLAQVRGGLYSGFILYPWNYQTSDDVRSITTSLQAAAQSSPHTIGLLIGADQEGGRVRAFRFPDIVQVPAQFDWGRHATPELAWSIGYVNGLELRGLGVNMNFAPVLDLYGTPDSTIIGDRSLGPDPDTVSALGSAYIRGTQAAGVIPVAKHFPGHGPATVDSHVALPVLTTTEDELFEHDIRPFEAAIDSGVEAVMTAHILFPAIDPNAPVTLSRTFLHDILRTRMHFGGVVVSDGLSMGALAKNYSLHDTLRMCFEAGVDLVLVHATYNVDDLVNETLAMVQSGEIDQFMVDSGAERILLLKLRHGLVSR